MASRWAKSGSSAMAAAEDALLVKYLFTSERLSVQVHPDDDAATAAGHDRGKDEAWLILDAEPGAEIAIGLKKQLSTEALKASALDGSIVDRLDWREVAPGDAFYSPAGTLHAIGAGLTLLEVQQNADITYRFFDYGRDRELHLDEAVAAADTESSPKSLDRAASRRRPQPACSGSEVHGGAVAPRGAAVCAQAKRPRCGS